MSRIVTASTFLVAGLIPVSMPQAAHSANIPSIEIVSSSADTVSGADALVAVAGLTQKNETILINGRDITRSFKPSVRTERLISLVKGLASGKNVLEVRIDGTSMARAEIVNHPINGPIFSGRHQAPFICQTEDNGLGPALDADCRAAPVIQYYYKSTEPSQSIASHIRGNLASEFKSYDPSRQKPSDVAQTVASGKRVNYIVRREIGVINRAVYEIRFLHEPGQPLPTPWTGFSEGWNGNLIYMFGGGCEAGFRQGVLPAAIVPQQEQIVSSGYATATSTLNVLANNCNEELSSETASMVKEYFIEQYGKPLHTIGIGGSSGAVSAYLTAQNHPDILDAVIAYLSAPDHLTTVIPTFSDCALLTAALAKSRYFWSEAQRTAISGFATWQTCAIANLALFKVGWLNPKSCPALIPEHLIYDKNNNPQGTRCTYFDNAINTFGRDPKTGFARRPLDNVGIQYGLVAFNNGKIGFDQFIELNELVGGFDPDGMVVSTRTAADEDSIRIAHVRRAVLTGENLGEIPMIDWSIYADDLGDIHTRDRAFLTRFRLASANGDARNQAIVVSPRPIYIATKLSNAVEIPGVGLSVLLPAMDQWLSNISTDLHDSRRLETIIRNKPSELSDYCISAGGEKIHEQAQYHNEGRCNSMYPNHGNPRIAAGSPLTALILKCALTPIDPASYRPALTSEQLTRMKSTFPTGVCDYAVASSAKQLTHTRGHL